MNRPGWAALGGTAMMAAAHAGPALASVPAIRRRVAPQLAGHGDPRHIALTFDDGPDPLYTPRLLRILDAVGVKATFFLLGNMLSRRPDLGRDLVEAGHEVALHGFEHRVLLARGPRAIYDDLHRGRDLIEDVTGVAVRWWRPPYGVLAGPAIHAARRLQLQPILWTAWGKDWTSDATAASVLKNIARDLRPGGTILLHDSDCTSAPGSSNAALAALPHLLTHIYARGLTVGPLREHGVGALRPDAT